MHSDCPACHDCLGALITLISLIYLIALIVMLALIAPIALNCLESLSRCLIFAQIPLKFVLNFSEFLSSCLEVLLDSSQIILSYS